MQFCIAAVRICEKKIIYNVNKMMMKRYVCARLSVVSVTECSKVVSKSSVWKNCM